MKQGTTLFVKGAAERSVRMNKALNTAAGV
jgi:hypothetical protein